MVSKDEDVLTVMRSVMRAIMQAVRDRPDLEVDPNLPLIRRKHPEWFDDEKPQ